MDARSEIADLEAAGVLDRLVEGQRRVLGEDLVGSYLFGSLATGDFEPGISDVDTATILRSDLTGEELDGLERLHGRLEAESPAWQDRIEAVYLSFRALMTFRTESSPAARISPGEPFHPIRVDDRWLIDWYQLRTVGVRLWGPLPDTLVPPISLEEYVDAVREHVLAPGWLDGDQTPGDQAYVVLTMCRGLRTCRTGEHVSKREAASWACEQLPGHADLIRDALAWRERSHTDPAVDGAATRDAMACFVDDVQRAVAASRRPD